MSENAKRDGSSYAIKMDDIMTKSMNEWWEGLSKEELLKYIEEQEAITADHIRTMMKSVNGVLAFDVRYGLSGSMAAVDFHIKAEEN